MRAKTYIILFKLKFLQDVFTKMWTNDIIIFTKSKFILFEKLLGFLFNVYFILDSDVEFIDIKSDNGKSFCNRIVYRGFSDVLGRGTIQSIIVSRNDTLVLPYKPGYFKNVVYGVNLCIH